MQKKGKLSKRIRYTGLLLMVLMMGVVSVAGAKKKVIKPKKLYLSASKKELNVGDKFTLKIKKAKPAKAVKTVKWSTSNKTVATVKKSGVVTAKKAGNAIITATSTVNKKIKAKCKISVVDDSKKDDSSNNSGTTNNQSTVVNQPTPVVNQPNPATEAPKVTEAPKKTEEPKITDEPKKTDEPKVTNEPKKTEEPKVTDEPKKTDEPKVTDEPKKTDEPKVTDEPKETTKPTAKPTTKPTVKPTTKPTTKPTAKPTAKPTTIPTNRPTDKPAEENKYGIKAPRTSTYGVTTWDCIKFGYYYINSDNSKEPITWRVLSIDGNNAMLLAEDAVEYMAYASGTDATWKNSSLRRWLNGSFMESAFTIDEQSALVKNSSGDNVSLLTADDTANEKYGFNSNNTVESDTRKAYATLYADEKNTLYHSKDVAKEWWLRAADGSNKTASIVSDGSINNDAKLSDKCAVRPVITINLACEEWSKADSVSAKVNKDNEEYGLKNPYRSDDGSVTWDCVYFGEYPQSSADSREAIKWRVLTLNGDQALLLADKCLELKPYNGEDADVMWKDSSLRSWLNNELKNKAFTKSEQNSLILAELDNNYTRYFEDESVTKDIQCDNTFDNVFLLSYDDALNPLYGFSSDVYGNEAARKAVATSYADAWQEESSYWWLRTAGWISNRACCVTSWGTVNDTEHVTDEYVGVRPAILIDLSAMKWRSAGTVTAKPEEEPTETPDPYTTPTPDPYETPEPTATATATPTAPATPTATAPAIPTDVPEYTVTFKNYDDTIITEVTVEEGEDAEPPRAPKRIGYVFKEWDGDYTDVSSDTVVKAVYEKDNSQSIIVGDVTVQPGDTSVVVPVYVNNNPGILGMTLTVHYDDSVMTLKGSKNGEVFAGVLDFTPPGKYKDGCNFNWVGISIDDEDVKDGEILLLTFDIADDAEEGSYSVSITNDLNDINDNDLNLLTLEFKEGYVDVSEE